EAHRPRRPDAQHAHPGPGARARPRAHPAPGLRHRQRGGRDRRALRRRGHPRRRRPADRRALALHARRPHEAAVGRAGEGDRRPHLAAHRPPARARQDRGALSFLEDVVAGLSLPQKALPPKYFYDAKGSKLFERICRLPEYYLTRAELALTRSHLKAIARFAGKGCELIEYGSGESLKTRLLIRALRPKAYLPVDISESALEG